ncbi:MAG TPA: hypothetical protein VM509_05510, partial [Planctomycetota bacterium]|nr:hypothetical protein [Planctomycetota bacterium]
MKTSQILITTLALLCASEFASAQITLIPPFTGQFSESFESQPSLQYDPCIVGRVFQNQADLCSPFCACSTIVPNWNGS